jgi:predicted O-methyltransferase YrrM
MEKVLDKIKNSAIDNKIPIIEDSTKNFLESFIKDNGIVNILEIGSAIGYSAIIMALVDPNIKVITIEKNELLFNEANYNIKNMNLSKQIDIYLSDAKSFETKKLNMKFDMIFVDGPKAQYQRYVLKFEDYLKPGGYFIFDNVDFHGMVETPYLTSNRNTRQLIRKIKDFRTWILNNNKYQSTYISKGDGIIVSQKK